MDKVKAFIADNPKISLGIGAVIVLFVVTQVWGLI
jgi:hypothetical protein